MAKKHRELIAREGWIYLFSLMGIAIVCLVFQAPLFVSLIVIVLAVYVAYFFRNPYRQIPEDPNAIVSPADGKVVGVHTLEDGSQLITIFLNIFNVHINRSPISGIIKEVRYTRGRFLAAYKEEASQLNERNALVIEDGDFQVKVIQIAGLIARRIVCWVGETETLAKGERFGLIKFGSRMDLVLPQNCRILAKPGQKVAGGSDILAERV